MNELELLGLVVERQKLMEQVNAIDEKITAAVLEKQSSINVGGFKATYYKPSVTYDYEKTVRNLGGIDQEALIQFTTVTRSIRWKDVCEFLGIAESDYVVAQEKPARVSISK